MADIEQLQILTQGGEIWNQWRRNQGEIIPKLSRADLGGVDLRKANLNRADLSGANLSRADLSLANLIGADLKGADLNYVNLFATYLMETNLRKASLNYTVFQQTRLQGADFSYAILYATVFAQIDLSGVKNLEHVYHAGPSSIDIDTLYRSIGQIPEVFLKGVGVPDSIITYLPSLIGKAIQYYSCFISYSTKDQEFAEQLHNDLHDIGIRCWFAPEDIKGGQKLHEQIPEAIRLYDKLLLVLSENSMASEWVKTEIYHARQDEIQNNKRKLFPVGLVDFDMIRKWKAFDGDIGKDMAREVREYFIPDFSNWKNHDAYQKAFDRLLRDLKASEL